MRIFFPMSLFDTVIDMLRNEDTVSLYWASSKKWGGIYTGDEPVGEEES